MNIEKIYYVLDILNNWHKERLIPTLGKNENIDDYEYDFIFICPDRFKLFRNGQKTLDLILSNFDEPVIELFYMDGTYQATTLCNIDLAHSIKPFTDPLVASMCFHIYPNNIRCLLVSPEKYYYGANGRPSLYKSLAHYIIQLSISCNEFAKRVSEYPLYRDIKANTQIDKQLRKLYVYSNLVEGN